MNAIGGNGLTPNGLTGNGLCGNGLAAGGLDAVRLASPSFATWFNTNPALSEVVMKYVYRCAAAAGRTINWTNPATGVAYAWPGGLGLAPGWVGGSPATVPEQQLVSACLAALTNKYGVSIKLAVEGRDALGVQLPIESGELKTYSVREGCFFGNLFAGQGVLSGLDHARWADPQSSARACAFDNTTAGMSTQCPPIVFVGSCKDFCVLDGTKTFYESCTYNGVTFKPLTTRILPTDVFTCGDGVCQYTERCGTRSEWWQCRDCGACP